MARYKVEKCTENETVDYGTWEEEDVKLIVRGYRFNGLFYERKNSKAIFIVMKVSD